MDPVITSAGLSWAEHKAHECTSRAQLYGRKITALDSSSTFFVLKSVKQVAYRAIRLSNHIASAVLTLLAASPFEGFGVDRELCQRLDQQLRRVSHLKSAGWEHQVIRSLRANRARSDGLELQRLRATGVLTPDLERKLNIAIRQVKLQAGKHPARNKLKVMMAQSAEVRRYLGQDYDVFIHAQATPWMVVASLMKECMKRQNPDTNYHQFKFLRNEKLEHQSRVGDALRSRGWTLGGMTNYLFPDRAAQTAQEYLKSKWSHPNDDFDQDRELLISADALLHNYATYESSLFFLANNSNISQGHTAIRGVLKNIANHFNPHLSASHRDRLIRNLMAAVPSFQSEGNLYTVCVPKVRTFDYQYRAHPFGAPCNCHSNHRQVLDRVQQNILDASTRCTGTYHLVVPCPAPPQFRLYTPMLRPEKGVKVYLQSPVAKTAKQRIRAQARTMAQALIPAA